MTSTMVRGKRGQPVVEVETGDLSAVLKLAMDCMEQHKGKPASYANTPEGLERFRDATMAYFRKLDSINRNMEEKQKVLPDIEGWCLFLGISRMTLSTYDRKRDKDWSDFIQMTKGAILTVKKQLIARGQIPPIIAIFDLVNNYSYQNTSQVVVDNRVREDKPVMTLEDLPDLGAIEQKDQRTKDLAFSELPDLTTIEGEKNNAKTTDF